MTNMSRIILRHIRHPLFIFLLLWANVVKAQDLVFNEILASNSHNIQDSKGDYPDWIELFNSSSSPVNLEGYSITDDRNEPGKWVFPIFQLPGSEYLILFAAGDSGTARLLFWNTLVKCNDEWKYIVPSSEPSIAWRNTGFDDGSWLSGSGGIGYGDSDDATVISPALSVYMRKRFQVADLADIGDALLQIDYDDAFVAYLNGTEIARANIGNPGYSVPFNSVASGYREAVMVDGGDPEKYVIPNIGELLKVGENILAIQVHNQSITSSDMSAIPYLSVQLTMPPSSPPPPELNLSETNIYTGFKIDADGDTLFLFNPQGQLIDSVIISPIPPDYSIGRKPDGMGAWNIFPEPTPGESNSTEAFLFEATGEPVFSVPGGFYPSQVIVSLSSGNTEDTIYYTIDGSEPGASSTISTSPVTINTPTVIRARIIRDGHLPGPVVTNTYITGRKPSLPVLSISTDSGNLSARASRTAAPTALPGRPMIS